MMIVLIHKLLMWKCAYQHGALILSIELIWGHVIHANSVLDILNVLGNKLGLIDIWGFKGEHLGHWRILGVLLSHIDIHLSHLISCCGIHGLLMVGIW
jgi:hypothetical protein